VTKDIRSRIVSSSGGPLLKKELVLRGMADITQVISGRAAKERASQYDATVRANKVLASLAQTAAGKDGRNFAAYWAGPRRELRFRRRCRPSCGNSPECLSRPIAQGVCCCCDALR
jgi:hypothetical protein